MDQQTYLSPTEAGQLFPRPIKAESVRLRITKGISGVKLAASFDGRRYWVRPEAVPEFLKEIAEVRRTQVQYLSEWDRDVKERHALLTAKYFGK